MAHREDLPQESPKAPSGTEKGKDAETSYADSLKLAYGDLSGEPRYGDQRYRPEPYQGSPDSEGGYYEALSASTVRPSSSATDGGVGSPGTDDQLIEDVSNELKRHGEVDCACIEVGCSESIITLTGRVEDRPAKRKAEDVAYDVAGVRDVINLLTFL